MNLQVGALMTGIGFLYKGPKRVIMRVPILFWGFLLISSIMGPKTVV